MENNNDNNIIETLLKNSEKFDQQFVDFPVQTNRSKTLIKQEFLKQCGIDSISTSDYIAQAAQSIKILIHQNVWDLIPDFFEIKKKSGTEIEKKFYQNMSREDFVMRCFLKRPIVFFNRGDQALLRSGMGTVGKFDLIGTPSQEENLQLEDYISYDEMLFSALFSVSSETIFINDGNRNNCARVANPSSFEPTGVYVGQVGARFERPQQMESLFCLARENFHTVQNGYGKGGQASHHRELMGMWAKLYYDGKQDYFPSFNEVTNPNEFTQLRSGGFLNQAVFKKRMSLILLPFLQDANDRAQAKKKQAYIHGVGLGLGVWQVSDYQVKLMFEAYDQILQQHPFPNISDLDFSWIPNPQYHQIGSITGQGGTYKTPFGNSIQIHFSKRSPAEKLPPTDSDKLIVAHFAWDSNSFPGNEYWHGMLTASGDPAAAACSQISELHNPYVNPAFNQAAIKVISSRNSQEK